MDNSKGLFIRSLDWILDLAHKIVDKGYMHAWFTWLEWIFVTSLILVAAKKSNSVFLWILGVVCAVLVLLAGLVGVEKVRDSNAISFLDKKNGLRLMAVVISLFGMLVVLNVVLVLLPASVS